MSEEDVFWQSTGGGTSASALVAEVCDTCRNKVSRLLESLNDDHLLEADLPDPEDGPEDPLVVKCLTLGFLKSTPEVYREVPDARPRIFDHASYSDKAGILMGAMLQCWDELIDYLTDTLFWNVLQPFKLKIPCARWFRPDLFYTPNFLIVTRRPTPDECLWWRRVTETEAGKRLLHMFPDWPESLDDYLLEGDRPSDVYHHLYGHRDGFSLQDAAQWYYWLHNRDRPQDRRPGKAFSEVQLWKVLYYAVRQSFRDCKSYDFMGL